MKKVITKKSIAYSLLYISTLGVISIISVVFLTIQVRIANNKVADIRELVKDYEDSLANNSIIEIIPMQSTLTYTKSKFNQLIVDFSGSYSTLPIKSFEWDIGCDGIYDFHDTIGILRLKYEDIEHLLKEKGDFSINVKISDNSGKFAEKKVNVVSSSSSFYVLIDSLNLKSGYCKFPAINTDAILSYENGDTIWGDICKQASFYRIKNIDGTSDYTGTEIELSYLFPSTESDIIKLYIEILNKQKIKIGQLFLYLKEKPYRQHAV